MQIGQYQRALYDFSAAVRFDEGNSTYYSNRGNCLLQLNQITEALKEFERAIELNSQDGYQININKHNIYINIIIYIIF